MKCRGCARDIPEDSRYCLFCGIAAPGAPGGPGVAGGPDIAGSPDRAGRRLMRSRADRKIAGVCGGVAEYFDLDATVVRLVWALAVILPIPLVPACLAYLLAWVILPLAPAPAWGAARVTMPEQAGNA